MSGNNIVFAMTGALGVTGGIAAVNLGILHALVDLAADRGVGLTVLSLSEGDADRPDFLPERVRYRAFRGNKFAFTANLLRLAHRRPVYFFERVGLASPLLPLAAAGVAKTIVFAHGWENWLGVREVYGWSVDTASMVFDRSAFSFRTRQLYRWSIRTASLVLTNSDYTLRKIKEDVSHVKGRACQLGLSPLFSLNEEVSVPSGSSTELEACDGRSYELGDRVLLLTGRMHPAERLKGHYALLEILPALRQRYPDVQLVFAGPGDDRPNIQRLAQDKGLASSVFLPGHVSVEVLEELYRHCYAFVMPSKQEGFGLVYLEAMNHGKPCVGCLDDGAGDVIVDGDTGFLVRDPSDFGELLEVLCRLLDDPDHARLLGQRGFERLHAHFTAAAFQERVKKAISGLL